MVELLVVISIIALLAALAFPAMSGAILKAHLLQATHNGQQLHAMVLQASLDASTSGNFTVAFPGDMSTPPADMVAFLNALKTNGYLTDFKIAAVDNVAPASATLTPSNVAFSMGVVSSSSPDNVPLFTTKNFNPSGGGALSGYVPPSTGGGAGSTPTATTTSEAPPTDPGATGASSGGAPAAKPFGATGFAVVHKAGDAQSFKPNMYNQTQGDAGTYVWGLDPSKAVPTVGWLQTSQ